MVASSSHGQFFTVACSKTVASSAGQHLQLILLHVTLTEKLGVAWMGTRLQKGISVCNDETLRMGLGMWLDLGMCSIGGYVLYVYTVTLSSIKLLF